MTYGDPAILDLLDRVDTQQLIMVPKRKTMNKISFAKRQRKVVTLRKKIELLHVLAIGQSVASVGRRF